MATEMNDKSDSVSENVPNSTGQNTNASNETFVDLVRSKIDSLRPKLLDLSRRNPLVATKFSSKTNTHIRVVDELPDVLIHNLVSGEAMLITPLPSLEEDPRDEDSPEFRASFSNALLTETKYREEVDAIDETNDSAANLFQLAERALKDRIREQLQLPTRQTQSNLSVAQHAENNGIRPQFELPLPADQHEDGRHTDSEIQTLLLPDTLERKLNSLMTKCRTWLQDTGINVMHCAFGFLEWKEPNSNDSHFAPLILLPVQIKKERTPDGPQFYMQKAEGEPELNAVLAEKLRREFSIEIPALETKSVETYLEILSASLPTKLQWRARRQVVIGVFPSARMAMYEDLETASGFFDEHEVVTDLFVKAGSGDASPFAEDYAVDEPEISSSVPFLLRDADSSQFSTLVDLAQGVNLAVEGPPGSGKSQTIVNAIGAAVAEGKKVLFVAEKLAALDVVKSRLEAVGLGDFILPLQAGKASKAQIVKSITERLSASPRGDTKQLSIAQQKFDSARSSMSEYIEILRTEIGQSGLNVHEVLGAAMKADGVLHDLPTQIIRTDIPNAETLGLRERRELRECADSVEDAWRARISAELLWKSSNSNNLTKFDIEALCERATEIAELLSLSARDRAALSRFNIEPTLGLSFLEELRVTFSEIQPLIDELDHALVAQIVAARLHNDFVCLADVCSELRTANESIKGIVTAPLDQLTFKKLTALAKAMDAASLNYADPSAYAEHYEPLRDKAEIVIRLHDSLELLVRQIPHASQWSLQAIGASRELLNSTDSTVLELRSSTLSADSALALLRENVARGLALQERRSDIESIATLPENISSDELRSNAVTLINAGWLSLLSPGFRKAKREYQKLSKRAEFLKEDASSDLRRIADYLDEERKFLSDQQVATVFGVHFRGIETNFELHHQLVHFLTSVEERIGGVENRDLRRLLKTETRDVLELIPAIDSSIRVDNFDALRSSAKAAARELEHIDKNIERFEICARTLAHPSRTTREAVKQSATLLQRILHLSDGQSAAKDKVKQFGAVVTEITTGSGKASVVIDALRVLLKHPSVLDYVVEQLRSGSLAAATESADKYLNERSNAYERLRKFLDDAEIVSTDFVGNLSDEKLADALNSASSDSDGLSAQVRFNANLKSLEDFAFRWVVDELTTQDIPITRLSSIIDALISRALAKRAYMLYGDALTRFQGVKLDTLRTSIADLDREIIELSRDAVATRLISEANPPQGNGTGRKATYTEMSLINNEINKKKGHIAVRQLVQRAASALLELKPCWMMSPLAVAQYIPKDSIKFDLCIIDEASQMRPEDAVGALARSHQCMVVGDTNQLPPTSFFQKMLDDDDEDDEEAVVAESILEMANTSFQPKRRLRWHYRSKHSTLIQFSNRLVYDDDLVIFPSAQESHANYGVSLVEVDGIYKSGTNPREAAEMVKRAVRFMKDYPYRSLGLVTLNQKQRDLLIDEMEYALSQDRSAAAYIDRWQEANDGLETFFIKNLENVQGDERDVIFIGTVYGPENSGSPVMQRFGPINGQAGQRRLNVLFTRAREQIVTFSSMTASDIQAEESDGNPGKYMLKRWLEYAATGKLEAGTTTYREPDSEFEEHVIEQLRAIGCDPVPQVGAAGYFIDIGVKHSDWPHGYILAVECDGASYHSSKSARDRDRLRQEVLERLGWKFHRIWSTDWFENSIKETEKLRLVIAERLEELRHSSDVLLPLPDTDDQSNVLKAEEPKPEYEFDETDISHSNSSTGIREQSDLKTIENQVTTTQAISETADVGDEVTVTLKGETAKTMTIILSNSENSPGDGIVHIGRPLGKAIMGSQVGDEIDFLVGERVQEAVVDAILKR